MSVGSKKPESLAYVAGICFFASFAMFWQLGKDMVASGQIRFAVGLGLAILSLVLTVKLRDNWLAEKNFQKEQQKFIQKLEEIGFELSLVKKQRDELESEKELLNANLDAAYVLREERPFSLASEHQIESNDRAHVSNNLAILNQTAAKFWVNADRDDRSTHPSKNEVVAWLMDHGFSQKQADSGATIIRPEWVPTGRKAEE